MIGRKILGQGVSRIVLSGDCTLSTLELLLICIKTDMSHDGLPLADCRANIYAVKFPSLKLFAQTLGPAYSYILLA